MYHDQWIQLLTSDGSEISQLPEVMLTVNDTELNNNIRLICAHFTLTPKQVKEFSASEKWQTIRNLNTALKNLESLEKSILAIYNKRLQSKNISGQEYVLQKNRYIKSLVEIRERIKKSKNLFEVPSIESLTMAQLFEYGEESYDQDDLVAEISKRMTVRPKQQKELIEGPFEKTKATRDFEELISYILKGEPMQLSQNTSGDNIIAITRTGKSFNMRSMMQQVNMSHVSLTDDLHKMYVQYVMDGVGEKPTFQNYSEIPGENEFNRRDPEGTLTFLQFSEKIAINIYTGSFSQQMNGLLRGKSENYNLSMLQEIILHLGFCASGLNKIPIKRYNVAFRGESWPIIEGIAEERLKAVEEGGYTIERGFVSTAADKIASTFNGNMKILFTGGILGQDISAVSFYQKEEREILQIPTQVKWHSFCEVDGIYYLHGQPVRTLSALEPDPLKTQKVKHSTSFLPAFNAVRPEEPTGVASVPKKPKPKA